MIANILLSLLLVGPFGYTGLAYSASISYILQSLILFLVFYRRGLGISYVTLVISWLKTSLVSAVASAIAWFIYPVLESFIAGYGRFPAGSFCNSAISLSIVLLLGMLVVFALASQIMPKEANALRLIFSNKLLELRKL